MAPGDKHAAHDIVFHQKTAHDYDAETTREYSIYHSYALLPFLDRAYAEGRTAVDLGAGTGLVTMALAKRGFRVVAIDHSPDMLEIARSKAKSAGLEDRIEFVEGDLFSADLPAADLVTAQGVLHHLSDLDEGVAVIARTLKPGGHFYVADPSDQTTPIGKAIAVFFPIVAATRRALLRRPANVAPPSVERPIDAPSLFRSLRAHGLDYHAEFFTHLPRSHRWAGERLRLWLTLLISRPWRHRRGDQVLVRGTRRPASPPSS
jgi:SAM-dependent methyltransferase